METAVVIRGVVDYQSNCGYGGNNEAEWLALIRATRLALSSGERDVQMLGDSALVVLQANGINKCHGTVFRSYLSTFMDLKSGFAKITVKRIGRSQNLAGIALSKLRWQSIQVP